MDIYDHLKKDQILNKLILILGELKLYTKPPNQGYKYLVDSIIGQQLSVKASDSIISKVENHFGIQYDPQEIINATSENLRSLGVSARKAEYLKALSNEVINESIKFSSLELHDNNQVIEILSKVKGIGIWTSKMYLMFVLGRQNVFPEEDTAFKEQIKKLYCSGEDKNLENLFASLNKKWNPYQSYGVLYMWKSKDDKIDINDYQ